MYHVHSVYFFPSGSDYEQISEPLTFTSTAASNQIRINLFEDLASEGLEEFFLRVVLLDERLGLPGVVAEATVFIFDNESELGNGTCFFRVPCLSSEIKSRAEKLAPPQPHLLCPMKIMNI